MQYPEQLEKVYIKMILLWHSKSQFWLAQLLSSAPPKTNLVQEAKEFHCLHQNVAYDCTG